MSPGLKHLYISTLSFSVALTSSFLTCPRNGSDNTTSPTHKMCTLANLGFTDKSELPNKTGIYVTMLSISTLAREVDGVRRTQANTRKNKRSRHCNISCRSESSNISLVAH